MIKLVVLDLDNVIIDGEAIDEIGKLMGVEDKIINLTKRAMEGEIDFKESLEERVKLLKGARIDDIKKLAQTLPLMEGAKETIKYLKGKGCKVATITGSFDLIADIIGEKLNLDYIICNKLHHKNGLLTGEVSGPLVEKTKYDILKELLEEEGFSFDECVAVGDGANDISMLESAKLGIAFNAKPIVKEKADIIVEEKNLKCIIPFIEELEESNNITLEEALDKKSEYEDKLSATLKERDELNNKAKEKKELRDELNNKAKEALGLAIKFRDKRNEINKMVEENKRLRDETNKKIRELKWSPFRRKRLKLEKEIRKIDKIIETQVLDMKKENELVNRANDLRKELAKIKEDEKTMAESLELKKLSEKYHENVVKLSNEAQEYHEKMLEQFQKTDEIRAQADEAHNEFVKFMKLASKKHEESKKIMEEIKQVNKQIKAIKSKMGEIEAAKTHKREIIERKKAEEIYKLFKDGKKLTKDELLLLQRYKIV
ncbi:MAG TPA: phosphoserine phosphatase SerB [Methanothermobacter sp.]|nr:phosphoserine phosphatase [Methanothermobacter sp. MT-2]HHW05727.1 phosphoserine phosphatase SerB [Methanothermobacter sp.]HOK72958.1 phosphoserine phosphatase SerB [Methanothermobacter sp.]HOL69264.1 phosphoserine phosphatase SerB [Methanothermobacter sp.]HPQ04482.1 phosphoserine phosphatase SerB [Methanothermobacter sp.]